MQVVSKVEKLAPGITPSTSTSKATPTGSIILCSVTASRKREGNRECMNPGNQTPDPLVVPLPNCEGDDLWKPPLVVGAFSVVGISDQW